MFPLISLFLFWVDISIYQLFELPYMYGVTLCYCLLLLRTPAPYPSLIVTLLLSGLESFLIYGRYGANFLLLLPITLLGMSIARHITITPLIMVGFATFTLLLHIYLLPWLMQTI